MVAITYQGGGRGDRPTPGGTRRVCLYGERLFGLVGGASVRGCVGVIVADGRRSSPTLSVVVPGCRRLCCVCCWVACGCAAPRGGGGNWVGVFVCGCLQYVTGWL